MDLGWQAGVCPGSGPAARLCWEGREPQAWSSVLFHQITCPSLPILLSTSLGRRQRCFSKQEAKDVNVEKALKVAFELKLGLLNEAVRNTILGLLFQACLNGGHFALAFKGCLLVDIHLLPPLHRTPPDLF